MILTVTPNPALDHTVQLDEPLSPDTVARTDRAQFDAGGKGINVAQYLDGLGASTTATGFLGGRFGDFVADDIAEAGIPSDFVRIREGTRVNTSLLTPAGEYKINHDGPHVNADAVDSLVEAARRQRPDSVAVCGSLPPGVGPADVDRLAAAESWDVAVDAGGELLCALDAEYALCKPNRAELAAATGDPVSTVEECLAAADSLRDEGFERVVASLGGDGAVLSSASASVHAAPLDVDVVDTVGAGDALLAGFLSAVESGRSATDALRLGVVVASRVVGVTGTRVPDFTGIEDDASRVGVTRY